MTNEMLLLLNEARDERDRIEALIDSKRFPIWGVEVLSKEFGRLIRAIEHGRRYTGALDWMRGEIAEARHVREMWERDAKRFGW